MGFKEAILMIVILVIVLAILFYPFVETLRKESYPNEDEPCNTLSDCSRNFPGLKPVDCKMYNSKKVCWSSGVGHCPLIYFIIPEPSFCLWIK
jgi:hypothetical protein